MLSYGATRNSCEKKLCMLKTFGVCQHVNMLKMLAFVKYAICTLDIRQMYVKHVLKYVDRNTTVLSLLACASLNLECFKSTK